MKSLLITNDFPPVVSGISTYFYHLWQHLPGDETLVLAPKVKNSSEIDRYIAYQVIRRWIPLGESNLSKFIKMLLNCVWGFWFALTLKISKIHCGQIVSTGLCGLLCKKLLHLPYAIYVCGSESVRFSRNRIVFRLLTMILNEANEIIVNSESTKQEYLNLIHDHKKLIKITPGVDTHFFKPLPAIPKNKTKILLTVSRLDERKGHDKVIESLPALLEKHPDVVYYIIGEGREKDRLLSLAVQHHVNDKIKFIGIVTNDELRQYYNECDIFILPNRITETYRQLQGDIEGFGIVFLEAAACGKVTIGGKNGGAIEAIENEVTGILVNPNSCKEITAAVLFLLDNPERAREMGEAGRRRVVDQFDWTIIAKFLAKLIT